MSDRIPSLFARPADRRTAAVAWAAAIAASFVLIALTGFTSGDPDSNVYAGISARLATEPFAAWIAPEWWGQWGFAGLFREHPVGIFLLPALVGRLGYPGPQAAYAVNGVFQAVCIVLIQLIAVRLVAGRDARALGWVVQLMPIAFVFRVRANQEYAMLAGVLLALLATERSRERPAWASLTAVGFAWALLVKGVFGFVVPIVCAVWLAARGARWRWSPSSAAIPDRLKVGPGLRSGRAGPLESRTRQARPWLALGLVLLVAPVLTIAYELAYRAATGDSFLSFYAGPRLRPDAVAGGALDRAAYNTIWYTARLAWYAFPWSLIALGACAVGLRTYVGQGFRPAERTPSPPARHRGFDGLLFAVAASLVLILLFSLSDRKADRFIFPAYYFMAAAGGAAAVRWSPALSRVVDRLDRPWVPAACWMTLFLLRLGIGSHLPQFTFWRS